MVSPMMLFSCTLPPCSSSSIFVFSSSLLHFATLVLFSSISCVTPCNSSYSNTWQQTCSSNNGRGRGVSISSFHFIRTKKFLHMKRKMRIHQYLLFTTTQEKRFLENANESTPPLVIKDLRMFSKSSSTIAVVVASASNAKET